MGGELITDDIQKGCSILKRQAERLKVEFGSALEMANAENHRIAIAGLNSRPQKEISVNNLARIIQARVDDIINEVIAEIKYARYSPRELGAGIVLTGGGALLKNIVQFTQYKTGMDVRIGHPDEHLAFNQTQAADLTSPIYSTGIGLLIEGLRRGAKITVPIENEEVVIDHVEEDNNKEEIPIIDIVPEKNEKSFLERIINKFFNDEPKADK
jgi:cell division protein FtsA